MKNGIKTILKKELARFFGDKKMVISILLPGLLIYVLYSVMGGALSNMFQGDQQQVSLVAVVNLPDSVKEMETVLPVQFYPIEAVDIEKVKNQVTEEETDLCVVFPEHFDADVAAYDVTQGGEAPNVDIYYNSASTDSQNAYSIMVAALDSYEAQMTNKFDINNSGQVYDVVDQRDTVGMIFSSMMPMLLLIFLFSGCMAVAPESIAGEKERGTLTTILVTPLKRRDLAIGKICALALISLISGASSFIGTMFSLPKLMGGAMDQINTNVYGPGDYLWLACIILTTVLLLITIISIVSATAKTVKEAQSAVTPLMILSIFVGVTGMFGGGARTDFYYYLIPLYNSVQSMVGVFSFHIQPLNLAVAVVSNLLYSAVGVWILTRMFDSEKVMFGK